jgi:hypothetical protein
LSKSGCRKPLLWLARSSSICEFIRDPLFLEACSKRSRDALHSGSTQHSANDFFEAFLEAALRLDALLFHLEVRLSTIFRAE